MVLIIEHGEAEGLQVGVCSGGGGLVGWGGVGGVVHFHYPEELE